MPILDSPGSREDFTLVEIRIFPSGDNGNSYPVELEVPGWRSFSPGSLRLDRTILTGRESDPPAYGRALGEMLFAAGAAGEAFRESFAAIQAGGGMLRLRLRIDPPDLDFLRWERILAPLDGDWQPLAAAAATPFSRSILSQRWGRPALVTERPLRVLAVIASPENLPTYKLDPIASRERQALHAMLDALPGVSVTYLESGTAARPTLNEIREALASGYHIVHFLCHGAASEGGTALYLESDDGTVELVKADRLLGAFALVKTQPLLCFLAACETAAPGRSRHDAFVPLGPALVSQGGVFAVIAMSDLVGLDTARLFTAEYYAHLLDHGVADLAMNQARALVQDQWDWGVPVLFCRLHDSQLIDFPVGKPIAQMGGIALAADHALGALRRQEEGAHLVTELERLLTAFEASFRNLVRLGSEFRATGADSEGFAAKFETFYLSFKDYYDQETFGDEQALLREMMRLKAETLPKMQPLLDADSFGQLKANLDQIATGRGALIKVFGEFLEPMNDAVDQIKAFVEGGDIKAAIARKVEFEMQISPGLRRSKELLGQISAGIANVQAA